jgi:predicted nucleic acid-binding protein
MARYLLDTSALLAHFHGEVGADRVQAILVDDSSEVIISSLTLAEFARGIFSLGFDRDQARRTALSYASLASVVVPVDAAIAIRAFELGTIANSRLPLADALIAASAQAANAVLVHRDKHFHSIPLDLLEQMSLSEE